MGGENRIRSCAVEIERIEARKKTRKGNAPLDGILIPREFSWPPFIGATRGNCVPRHLHARTRTQGENKQGENEERQSMRSGIANVRGSVLALVEPR